MLKKNDFKTGMKVKTKAGKFYYVVQDWIHKDEQTNTVKVTAILIAADRSDKTVFYGFFNYDENLNLNGDEENEWNIESVYIFTGEDLQNMSDPEYESEWIEITEGIKIDQRFLERYFAKFE